MCELLDCPPRCGDEKRAMAHTTVRILLAAGESSIAARLGNALEIAGFEVAVVTCGGDVIRVCSQCAPDILVCDSDLPGGDVMQLARRLRRQGAPFPVILLVADDPFDSVCASPDRVPAAQFNTHLIPAPCDEQRLVDLVQQLASELRSTAPWLAGFPTRVIWPTARRRTALPAR